MLEEYEQTEPSLYLSYNSNSDKLPADFKFTSYLLLKPNGMFSDFIKGEKYVIACGTFEGAILILGKKSNETKILKKISLLCGHEFPVCSMIQTLQETHFLSISTDGTICCWSLFDFSCIFKKKAFHEQGNYELILSWVYPHKVWVISTGLFFCLFDLRLRSVLRKIKMPGILSFCVLSPTRLSYLNKFIAVTKTVDKILIFNIELKTLNFHVNREIPLPATQSTRDFYLSEYGVVQIDKEMKKWRIVNILTLKTLLLSHFNIEDDDSISDVEWKSQETIVFSTYKGQFLIVQAKFVENQNEKEAEFCYEVKSTQTILTDLYCNKFIFNDFFYTNDIIQIVFSPDNRSVVLISPNKDNSNEHDTIIFKTNKKKKNVSFPIHPNLPEYLTIKRSNEIVLVNSTNGQEIDSFVFSEKVTSIYFGSDTKSGNMIIVAGHKNGSISFYDRTTRRIVNIEALPSEVVAFAHLPIKKEDHNVFLAISYNSACLIKKETVDTFYLVNQYQIISVLFYQGHIFFKHINGLIEAFSINSDEPIFLTEVPKKAKLLWTYFNKDSIIKNRSFDLSRSMDICLSKPKKEKSYSSIIMKNIGYNSFCYHFYNISNMIRNSSSEEIIEMLNYVKIICNLKLSKNCSYVLIGSDNDSQTFFYPGFSAFSGNIINASDQITASHFLINVMLKIVFKVSMDNSPELQKDYVRCLPLFINFLVTTESQVIKKFLSSVCIDLTSFMTFVKCQNLAESLTIDNEKIMEDTMSNYLSLSFVAAKHPECIKPHLIPPLLHFLLDLSEKETIESELALFLLIDGKSKTWLKYFGYYDEKSSEIEKKAFYHKIIISICKNRKMNFLINKFCNDVYNDMEAYCETLVDIVNNETCDIKKIVNMFALVATTNTGRSDQDQYDPMDIVITLANFWNNSKTCDIIDGIFSHFSMFHNISHQNSVLVVGKNNGEVFVFSKGKKAVSDHPFSTKVDVVSISPNASFFVAISNQEKKSCLFQIKINLLKKMSLVIVESSNVDHNIAMINWTAEDKWSHD